MNIGINGFPAMRGTSTVSRRRVLSGFAGAGAILAGGSAFAAQAASGFFKPSFISHVGCNVSDLRASAEFYQKLFGFPPLMGTVPPAPFPKQTYGFYFNDRFLSLVQTPKERAGQISHYCIACETLDAVKDGKRLTDAGFKDVRSDVADTTQSVSLADPDNNHLQLFDKKLTGSCPSCDPAPGGATAPPPADPLFKARMYSHVGITVADLKRAKDFYHRIFELPANLRPLAPPTSTAYALDFAGQFISLTQVPPPAAAPSQGKELKPGTVTHFGIAVDNLNAERDGEKLRKAGMQVRIFTAKKDLVESLSVVDPDGLHIQISDAGYTYPCPTCQPSPV